VGTDLNQKITTSSVPGTIISPNLPLIYGTPMRDGQSCGNEGTNVFVDSVMPPLTKPPIYKGCFTDNAGSPSMTFIGGTPPPSSQSSIIVNGDFSQPALGNNSWQQITSSSAVPGWNFNAYLVNSSNDFGFPIPYPNGSQCAAIQLTNNLSQTVNLSTGTHTLTFYAIGKNVANGSNPVNIQLNGNTFYSVKPPGNKWTKYSTTFRVTTAGNNLINFAGTASSVNQSTAFQSISISNGTIPGGSNSQGTYTYDMCKNSAISGGYRYFSLQNMNPQTSKGYCAVTNNAVGFSSNGTSTIVVSAITLWSSKTSGQIGSTAILNSQGVLSVVKGNTSIFGTPASSEKEGFAVLKPPAKPPVVPPPVANSGPGSKVIPPITTDTANALPVAPILPSDYIGCYGDRGTRAMTLYNGGAQKYDAEQCKAIAQKAGMAYFGLQNSRTGKTAQCAMSNNLAQAKAYGKANNCTKLPDGTYTGGAWSNAIYIVSSEPPATNVLQSKVSPNSIFFLILQDDGNLCIYRGSGPNDKQGLIWSSNTQGKRQKPNPKYVAAKGKYGKNYISVGSTLSAGDFVGSNDGTTYLLMQQDGNLVLYTSQDTINCSKMCDGNMGGGVGANAVYDVESVGFANNVGKIGYVDDDGNLSEYPASLKGFTNKYIKFNDSDSPGNNIGTLTSNTTNAACSTKCNTTTTCAGYVYDNNAKTCAIKNSSVYPKTPKISSKNVELYVREPKIISGPGSNRPTNIINSIQWQNYKNTGKSVSDATFINFGLVNNTDKQTLDQLTGQLNLLAKQITDKTNKILDQNSKMNKQMTSNKTNFKDSANEFNRVTSMNQSTSLENIGGIVKDSSIHVLQENYRYIVWSILAVGVVSLSLNVLNE
jgi:hypothetical protein